MFLSKRFFVMSSYKTCQVHFKTLNPKPFGGGFRTDRTWGLGLGVQGINSRVQGEMVYGLF